MEKIFASVSTVFGIDSLEKIEIRDDLLYISGYAFADDEESKAVEKTISAEELNKLISENGVEEI